MWCKEATPSNTFSKNSSENDHATSDIDSLNSLYMYFSFKGS